MNVFHGVCEILIFNQCLWWCGHYRSSPAAPESCNWLLNSAAFPFISATERRSRRGAGWRCAPPRRCGEQESYPVSLPLQLPQNTKLPGIRLPEEWRQFPGHGRQPTTLPSSSHAAQRKHCLLNLCSLEGVDQCHIKGSVLVAGQVGDEDRVLSALMVRRNLLLCPCPIFRWALLTWMAALLLPWSKASSKICVNDSYYVSAEVNCRAALRG